MARVGNLFPEIDLELNKYEQVRSVAPSRSHVWWITGYGAAGFAARSIQLHFEKRRILPYRPISRMVPHLYWVLGFEAIGYGVQTFKQKKRERWNILRLEIIAAREREAKRLADLEALGVKVNRYKGQESVYSPEAAKELVGAGLGYGTTV